MNILNKSMGAKHSESSFAFCFSIPRATFTTRRHECVKGLWPWLSVGLLLQDLGQMALEIQGRQSNLDLLVCKSHFKG